MRALALAAVCLLAPVSLQCKKEDVAIVAEPPAPGFRDYTAMTGEGRNVIASKGTSARTSDSFGTGKTTSLEKPAPEPRPIPIQRKVIRDGDLRVLVETYEPAREAVEMIVREVKGFIASSSVQHASGHVSSASLVLKIPAESFGEVLRKITRLGNVISESTKADDITEAYYDLRARLGNARKLEGRLQELLAKRAGKIADLLQVERELARVREEIERFEGKLRLYDQLVTLSTLRLELQMRSVFTPPRAQALSEQLSDSLDGSVRTMKRFGRQVLRGAVALLPWSPLVAVGIWIPIRFWRKRRRAKASVTPSEKA